MTKTGTNKGYYGGAVALLLGLWLTFHGATYGVGTPAEMGPGFFPTMIGVLLCFTSVIIIAQGFNRTAPRAPAGRAEWRGWICIVAGIILFIAAGKYLGLLPATFSMVVVTALGDRGNTLKEALILGVAACAIAVGIFWWLLQIQFPLFTWGP